LRTITKRYIGAVLKEGLEMTSGSCVGYQTGHSFQCQRAEATWRRPPAAPRLNRHGVALSQDFGLGGFAERALVHENQFALGPKDMPFAQAALQRQRRNAKLDACFAPLLRHVREDGRRLALCRTSALHGLDGPARAAVTGGGRRSFSLSAGRSWQRAKVTGNSSPNAC
jgi:hypothetical protein